MRGSQPHDTMTNTFTTEDMALVATLKMDGCEPIEYRRSRGGCVWVFATSDGLEHIVDEYQMGLAMVEPREYTRKLALVRNRMYDFLKTNQTAART